MRFFGIVTLAIALLQREGRIAYRALKRGFELSLMRRWKTCDGNASSDAWPVMRLAKV
jgi:hypothetical protein